MWLHNYTGFLSFLLGSSISYSNCSTKETCDRGKGLVQEVHIFCLEWGKSLIPYRALILYGRKADMHVSFIVTNSQCPHTKLQCDLLLYNHWYNGMCSSCVHISTALLWHIFMSAQLYTSVIPAHKLANLIPLILGLGIIVKLEII